MKAKLSAGQEIDFVSPGELAEILETTVAKIKGDSRGGPLTQIDEMSIKLDGNGNSTGTQEGTRVYRVTQGFIFSLHRLVVDLDGYTPGVPYTSSTGFLQIQRNGKMQDFVTFANGLPAVYSQNGEAAIKYQNGQNVSVSIVGGPAHGVIVLRVQGTLEPLTGE